MMFIWPLLLASDSGLWPEDPSTEIAATPSSLLSADPNDNYKASLALGGAVAVRQSVQTVTRLATPTALESASVTWGTEAAILEGGATAAGGAEIVAGEGLLMGALRLATTLVRFSPLALIFMESDRPSREKPVEPAPEVYRTDIEAVGVPDYEAWKKWSEMEKHRRAIRWIEADGKRLKQSDGWIRWQIEKYLEENGLTLEDLDAFENPVESYAFKASSASGNNPAAEIDTTESPFLDAAGLQERILKAKGEGKRVVVEIGCGAEANHLRLLAEKNPDIVYFGIDPDPKIEEADSQSLPKNIFLHRGNAWPALQGLENQQAIDELLFVAPEGSDDFNRRRAEHNADLASWFHEPIPRMTFRNKELPLYYNLLAPGGKITIYTEVLEWAMDYCNRLSPVADRMETALYTDDAVFPEMSPRTELVIPFKQDISNDGKPRRVPIDRSTAGDRKGQWGSIADLFAEETDTPVFPREMAPPSYYLDPAKWPYVFKVEARKAASSAETATRTSASQSPPQLLSNLSRLIDVAKHPEKDRALLFLDTMLHSGLQSEREFRDPAQTKVAIVGFGDETATIKVFLDAGYQVIAVENFSYLKAANGPKKTEIEERFSDHPHLDRLTIIDVAEGTTLPEADLVIASALIDEAFETSARLVKRGGIIAVTEMGQVGSKRINYIVDAPDSYIREAQGIPRTFEEVLYFNTVHGPSILPSGFFHMFGHSAYILRRTE